MAYSSIVKPSVHFNTKLYTGNASAGHAITGVGFQPDFTWLKGRSFSDWHFLFDAVRGVEKVIYSNATTQEQTDTNSLNSFNSDGFTLGNLNAINQNSATFASWNWKANGAGSANTDGSINSTVSVNTTAGFSIVKWTGNGGTASVGHGLGVKPNIVIKKNLATSTNWIFSTTIIDGSNDFFYLNTTAAKGDSAETAPTSSLVNLYANSENNGNGNGMIAYCFAEKKGYSKFGSYTGNGSADGTFVYTGFKPAFVIYKGAVGANAADNWEMADNKRSPFNGIENVLYPNLTAAEGTGVTTRMDFLSNGFKMKTSGTDYNGSGQTYIYMAFSEEPIVANSGTDGVPATAR